MLFQPVFLKALKISSAAALVLASTLAYAGSTVRITNNSKQPWCLRITEEAAAPIIANGNKELGQIEMSAQNNKLVYYIQPGETCTLQFKEVKDLPVKKTVGVVDKSGAEMGQVSLVTQSAPLTLRASNQDACSSDDHLVSRIYPSAQVGEVLRQDSEDAISINADTWE